MLMQIGFSAIFCAGLISLFIAVRDVFLLPRDVWRIRLGKNFGILAVFLAVDIIVLGPRAIVGAWELVVPGILLLAGLSGFLKNPLFSLSLIHI